MSRIFLGSLAVAALVLASRETHEAIGSVLVGAAIAFGLGAAFFDRVVELTTSGVKLTDARALRAAAERDLPEVDADEKEELIAEGGEILADRRSAGEPITPELALKEAQISWVYNGLGVELRFASWLVERGWTVSQADQFVAAGQPDLLAEKDGRRVAVEAKVGRRPLGIVVVDQVIALAASVEAVSREQRDAAGVQPVLVLRGISLTLAAIERATEREVSVYEIDEAGAIEHRYGPEID